MNNVIRQVSNLPDSFEVAKEVALEGELLSHWGSRSLAWRIFLGLLPTDPNKDGDTVRAEWVKATRAMRQNWASLEKSMSLIAIASKNKKFNPLAPPKIDQDDKSMQEREMKDLIK